MSDDEQGTPSFDNFVESSPPCSSDNVPAYTEERHDSNDAVSSVRVEVENEDPVPFVEGEYVEPASSLNDADENIEVVSSIKDEANEHVLSHKDEDTSNEITPCLKESEEDNAEPVPVKHDAEDEESVSYTREESENNEYLVSCAEDDDENEETLSSLEDGEEIKGSAVNSLKEYEESENQLPENERIRSGHLPLDIPSTSDSGDKVHEKDSLILEDELPGSGNSNFTATPLNYSTDFQKSQDELSNTTTERNNDETFYHEIPAGLSHEFDINDVRENASLLHSKASVHLLSSNQVPVPHKRNFLTINRTHPRGLAHKRERRLSVVRERTWLCRSTLITIVLGLIVFPYMVGGAFLFWHLEENSESTYIESIDKLKNDTAILLATELRQVSPQEAIWARYIFKYLDTFEEELLRTTGVGYWKQGQAQHKKRWAHLNTFFYSFSLMTTTGYGNMTPQSEWGRTATVLYSLVGIPLMITWLICCGYLMAFFWSCMFTSLCCQGNPEWPKVPKNRIIRPRSNAVAPITGTISQDNQFKFRTANLRTTNSQNYKLFNENGGSNAAKSATFKMASTATILEMEKELSNLDHAVSIVFCLIAFLVYFVFGSALFAVTHGIAVTDVLYVSYLMIVSVGPGVHELRNDAAEIRLKGNAFYTAFLIFGFCLISMFFNLVYMFYHPRIRTYKQ